MEIPQWVQIGAKIVVLGAIMVILLVGVLVGFSLKAPPATWHVLELLIPIVLSAILGLLAFLFQQANRTPPYFCPSCHRRFSWRQVMAMRRIGSSVERDVQSNNALERTVRHGGPRLAAALAVWPAAQLGRYASF